MSSRLILQTNFSFPSAIWCGILFICLAMALPVSATAAVRSSGHVFPGDLVRTETSPAVYYVGPAATRYVFPNEKIFRSWYPDFSLVKFISPSEMASLQLVGNILYRPGSRLIKIVTDDKVYAVEPSGKLRWIQTEELAQRLYGEDWNKKIDDLPDVFFSAGYQISSPVIAPSHPVGSLIQYQGTAEKYLIALENGQMIKRLITDQTFEQNRLETLSLNIVNLNLQYPDGTPASGKEENLTDAAQLVASRPSTPLGISLVPTSEFLTIGQSATLASYQLTAQQNLKISEIKIRFTAKSADGDADENDLGGLIQNNTKANLSNLKLDWGLNSTNIVNLLTSPKENDQEQTVSFSLNLSMAAGQKLTVNLTGTSDRDIPPQEKFEITLLASQIKLTDTFTDQSGHPDLTNQLTLVRSGITVTANPPDETITKGAAEAVVGSFTFKASQDKGAQINQIKFTGFIDANEGEADFQPGRDVDINPALTNFLDSLLFDLRLYDAANNPLTLPNQINTAGELTFSLLINLEAGQEITLVLKGVVPKTVTILGSPDRIAFDIVSNTDLKAFDQQGNPLEFINPSPNGAANPKAISILKNNGQLRIKNDPKLEGDRYALLEAKAVKVSGIQLEAKYEAFKITQLAFLNRFTTNNNIKRVTLYQAGQPDPIQTKNVPGTFSNLSILVEPDNPVIIEVLIDLTAEAEDGASTQKIALDFAVNQFKAVGEKSGTEINVNNLKTDLIDNSSKMPTVTTRRSLIEFVLEPDSPVGDSERGLIPIIKFKIINPSNKSAILNRLTLRINTDDVASSGKNNDLLERLARENGDQPDDDNIADLFVEGRNTPLAEDIEGRLIYKVWDQSKRIIDSAPVASDYESAFGDYGILQYVFGISGHTILPGSQNTYTLHLLTSGVAAGLHRVSVQILTDNTEDTVVSNVEWSDGRLPASGFLVKQLPLSGKTIEFK